MTLYDEPEQLLQRAADVVERHGSAAGDENDRRELASVARLLRRIAAIWPDMFATLERENRVLSDSLRMISLDAAAAGLAPAPGMAAIAEDDPLVRYQATLMALDAWGRHLREQHGEWSAEALGRIRRALAESADIQGRIVDRAFAAGTA